MTKYAILTENLKNVEQFSGCPVQKFLMLSLMTVQIILHRVFPTVGMVVVPPLAENLLIPPILKNFAQ